MKIFISWSGERSQKLAEALREWLPLVLHYAKPWLSKSDIKAGDRWGVEVAKELQESNFGIICVTKDNLTSPWILFESGALAKSMEDGRVIPLLLDLDFKEISGPLAQFQAKKADQSGIKELVISLNKSAQEPDPEDRLAKIFDPLYADLGKMISEIPTSNMPQKHTRPQGEILEELVSGVRSVELRVRDFMDDEPVARRRMRRRIHPKMIYELTRELGRGPGDPIQILIVSSLFKEELPWLYELGMEAYRSVVGRDRSSAKRAISRYRDALKMARNGPLELLGIDSKMTHMMLMDALEFMPLLEWEEAPSFSHSEPETNSASVNSPARRRKVPDSE